MKFAATIIAAIMVCITQVMAGNATVENHCAFPVYLKSGTITKKLAAKTGHAEMTIVGTGRSIILAKSPSLQPSLSFDFTVNGNLVYYDLSNNNGNPFVAYTNELVPSVPTCAKFDCAPHATNCYSNGSSIKVKSCSSKTDLTTTLCA